MKTALVKTEKTAEGDKITIRIVDKVDSEEHFPYVRNVKTSNGISFVAIQVKEAADLFLNPFLFNYIKSLLA